MSQQVDSAYGEEEGRLTRERLLDAAQHLFAANGFRDTSVRQITAVAGANSAAVNYYFGGKDKLYREVMSRNLTVFFNAQLQAIRSVMANESQKPTVAELVRTFTRTWLTPVSTGEEHIVQLSFRERADRRLPDDIASGPVQAVEHAFVQALCQLTPLSADVARQCVRCLEVLLSGLLSEVITNSPARAGMKISDADLDELVEHVIRFSIAGINGFAPQ